MQKVLRYGSLGVAATLLISACAPAVTAPPTNEPFLDAPQAPAAGQAFGEDFMPAFPSDVAPLQLAPAAPQPPVSVKDQGLVLPTGENVTLDQLYQDLPDAIPQNEASDWLSPMPGAIPEGFGQSFPGAVGPGGFGPGPIGPEVFGPGGFGAFPGVIPDLLSYNALARCLYYPYKSFWVPYLLVGSAYFPYAYSPFYDDLLSGCYAYPLFYDDGDYCYPYTFLSSRYRYGYLDWEYNWPSYRSKHHRRYDDDFRRYQSRWGSRDFQGWLDDRRRERDHDNWRERAREHRRDSRPAYRDGKRPGSPSGNQPGNRPDRQVRPDRNDRQDRGDRPARNDRPNYQQGQRPEQRPGAGAGYQPGKRQESDRQGGARQNRPARNADDGDGRGRSGRGEQQVERDRGKVQPRPERPARGEQPQVRRGGEQQQVRRAEPPQARGQSSRGGQQARQSSPRGGQKQGRSGNGRMRPAGMETPDGENEE